MPLFDHDKAFDEWRRANRRLAFLESLADAAATWEGTREAEDWVVLQRLIHQWNSMNTESED